MSLAVATDAVTAFRREMKFTLHSNEVPRMIDLLRTRFELIRFGKADVSEVNSIYFDDDLLGSVEESLAGVGTRVKVRLRWYDQPMAGNHAYLEIKLRRGVGVFKTRTRVELPRPLGEMSYPELLRHLQHEVQADSATWLALRSRPVMLVAYDRMHFRDPQTDARLTIDMNIRGYEQSMLSPPRRRFITPVHDWNVLEAKISPGDEQAVTQRLMPFLGRPTRSSKYVLCCARMGWCCMSDRHD